MAASYWYWALAAVGVVMTVFILHNKKNVYECITFFLFAMMLAFVGK